jgi:hypothetical protein
MNSWRINRIITPSAGRPVTTQPAIAIMTEPDATASQVWQIWSDP